MAAKNTCCPECGHTIVVVEQKIEGTGMYYVDLAKREADFSSLHDHLDYITINEYAKCELCGCRWVLVKDLDWDD